MLCDRAGLRLGPDGKRCVDIDECAEGTAPCEQECENRDPREAGLQYVCKCRAGYNIDIDNNHKCILKVRPLPPPRQLPLPSLRKFLPFLQATYWSSSMLDIWFYK